MGKPQRFDRLRAFVRDFLSDTRKVATNLFLLALTILLGYIVLAALLSTVQDVTHAL